MQAAAALWAGAAAEGPATHRRGCAWTWACCGGVLGLSCVLVFLVRRNRMQPKAGPLYALRILASPMASPPGPPVNTADGQVIIPKAEHIADVATFMGGRDVETVLQVRTLCACMLACTHARTHARTHTCALECT